MGLGAQICGARIRVRVRVRVGVRGADLRGQD